MRPDSLASSHHLSIIAPRRSQPSHHSTLPRHILSTTCPPLSSSSLPSCPRPPLSILRGFCPTLPRLAVEWHTQMLAYSHSPGGSRASSGNGRHNGETNQDGQAGRHHTKARFHNVVTGGSRSRNCRRSLGRHLVAEIQIDQRHAFCKCTHGIGVRREQREQRQASSDST